MQIDRKNHSYRRGRRAGARNAPRASNPYPNCVGEWSDWDTGWEEGYHDIGWSRMPYIPRANIKGRTLPDYVGLISDNARWRGGAHFEASFGKLEHGTPEGFGTLKIEGTIAPDHDEHMAFLKSQFPTLRPMTQQRYRLVYLMDERDYAKMKLIFGGGW